MDARFISLELMPTKIRSKEKSEEDRYKSFGTFPKPLRILLFIILNHANKIILPSPHQSIYKSYPQAIAKN